MTHAFADIAFTPAVKTAQQVEGSRAGYARAFEDASEGVSHREVGPDEAAFIAEQRSIVMATVSETGWPYIQHRGGPAGFLRVIDERTTGFADFRGNRQYITVGNLQSDDRVSLFLVDYPNRARLKLLGRARMIGATGTQSSRAKPSHSALASIIEASAGSKPG